MTAKSRKAPADSAPATITRDEWIKAVADAGLRCEDDSAGTVTINEYAAMMDVTRTTAASQLGILVRQGKATETRRFCADARGHRVPMRAFRLLRKSP